MISFVSSVPWRDPTAHTRVVGVALSLQMQPPDPPLSSRTKSRTNVPTTPILYVLKLYSEFTTPYIHLQRWWSCKMEIFEVVYLVLCPRASQSHRQMTSPQGRSPKTSSWLLPICRKKILHLTITSNQLCCLPVSVLTGESEKALSIHHVPHFDRRICIPRYQNLKCKWG